MLGRCIGVIRRERIGCFWSNRLFRRASLVITLRELLAAIKLFAVSECKWINPAYARKELLGYNTAVYELKRNVPHILHARDSNLLERGVWGKALLIKFCQSTASCWSLQSLWYSSGPSFLAKKDALLRRPCTCRLCAKVSALGFLRGLISPRMALTTSDLSEAILFSG